MNNNLLTLNQIITNSSYQTAQTWVNSFGQQLLIYGLQNANILTFNPEQVIVNTLIQEFLLRVPYEQNLSNFQIRFIGIINKYTVNILNYCVKLQQLQNFLNLMTQNQTRSMNYNTNLTSDIKTSNTTNTAQAEAFNPVDNSNINIDLSKATNDATVTADGVSTASSSNSNFNTTQDQTQDTKHNMTEQDLATYNNLKFEADNLLQPVLTALNSLFYIFDVGEQYDYYSL